MRKPSFVLTGIGFLFLLAHCSALRAQPARLSLDEIIRGMEAFETRFNSQKSWMLRYVQTREIKDAEPGTMYDYPPNEMVNARKGEWMFNHEVHDDLKMNNSPPGTKQRGWLCWRDNICVQRSSDNRMWIWPEPSAEAYQCFFYTQQVHLNAQKDMKFRSKELKLVFHAESYEDAMWQMLPRSVKAHRTEFRVRPQLEAVDGMFCHVLERTGKDIIWVDTEHGFGEHRRIYYQAPGMPLFETHHLGFRERAPGIWLPDKAVTASYNLATAPAAYRGKIRVVSTSELREWRFNDLPDSFFEVPRIQVGLVSDYIRGIDYELHRANVDPVENVVKRARLDMQHYGSPSRRNWLEIFLIGGIVFSGLFAAYQVYRLVRQRRLSA